MDSWMSFDSIYTYVNNSPVKAFPSAQNFTHVTGSPFSTPWILIDLISITPDLISITPDLTSITPD